MAAPRQSKSVVRYAVVGQGYTPTMRDPKELDVPGGPKDAKVTPKELDMAERLVEDMAIDWDPAQYHDTYRDDLMKMIEEKAAGKTRRAPKAKRAAGGAEVIDFAALLERSLTAKRATAPAGKAVAARAQRKPPSARASQRRAA